MQTTADKGRYYAERKEMRSRYIRRIFIEDPTAYIHDGTLTFAFVTQNGRLN